MPRIKSALAVEQGVKVLFSDFADGGPMWTGQGEREIRKEVQFTESFILPPNVMVGLSMWDIDAKSNSRVDVSVRQITSTGCQLVFRTWGDSRVARVRVDWMAIGQVRDDDEWDVD